MTYQEKKDKAKAKSKLITSRRTVTGQTEKRGHESGHVPTFLLDLLFLFAGRLLLPILFNGAFHGCDGVGGAGGDLN